MAPLQVHGTHRCSDAVRLLGQLVSARPVPFLLYVLALFFERAWSLFLLRRLGYDVLAPSQ